MGVPSNMTARELFSPRPLGLRSRRLAALRTQNRLVYPIGGGAAFSSAHPFYMGRSVTEVAMDQRGNSATICPAKEAIAIGHVGLLDDSITIMATN